MPKILLARLPAELVDVLLLLEVKHPQLNNEAAPSPALRLALYWLIFVTKPDKASDAAYQVVLEDKTSKGLALVREIITAIRKVDAAFYMPSAAEASAALKIEDGEVRLKRWEERFNFNDSDPDKKPGDILRQLSSDRKRQQNLLLWLQRGYLQKHYRDFDPTSGRDEDLPVDWDHMIPSDYFNFDWGQRAQRADAEFHTSASNFREQRGALANHLGNMRWLDASENRSRQDKLSAFFDDDESIDISLDKWGAIHSANPDAEAKFRWNPENLRQAQQLIQQRTVSLYVLYLKTSGLEEIAAEGKLL